MIKSATSKLLLHFNLSRVKSSYRLHSLWSIVTTSIHVVFGLSIPLDGLSTCIEKVFLTYNIACLACIRHGQTISNEFLLFNTYWCTLKCPESTHTKSIFSRFTTHPPQHFHLYYTYFVHVLPLYRPKFYSICHSWSNRCPIKSSLQSRCTNMFFWIC